LDTGEPAVTKVKRDTGAAGRRLSPHTQIGILCVVGALVLCGLVVGPALYRLAVPRSAPAEASAPSAPGTFRPTAQQWAGLKIEPIETIPFRDTHETDGLIANDDDLTTPVFSPYSGRVTKLFAKAGDDVAQGASLFAVQATELVQAQNDLISASATLRTARAQLNLAQTSEKRQHQLFLAQGGALKDWQQSQVDLATAQGGLATAQIALAAVRNRLRILGRSPAEIEATETAPDTMQLDPDAVVASPIGGTITARQVGLGQNIVSAASGGSTPVFQIGDLSKVWLVANAPETDSPLLHLGDVVEVHVLAFPGQVFKAKLTYIGASIDPNTHRLPVRAEVENPDRALKPQMFASFTIITGADEVGPAVPDDAVIYEGDVARVWVARADKTLELRTIKIGRNNDRMVEALAGLEPNEAVVTSGSVFIDRAAKGD
jgi:cobalt-zinc-cadmium efflux system membrane fusion protein